MYNLRYHIASLVSVFIALAIGLVLGGLVVDTGAFNEQSDALIKGLHEEFNKLHEENSALAGQNKQLEDLSAGFVDAWTADRLAGQTVIVVTNAGRSSGLDAVAKAVQSAGGNVATITLLKPQFGLASDDDVLRSQVTSLAADQARPAESIAATLVAEWLASSSERLLTEQLVDLGVISVTGLGSGAGEEGGEGGAGGAGEVAGAGGAAAAEGRRTDIAGLVNIAAPEKQADPVGFLLAEAARDGQVVAVGAQTSGNNTKVASGSAERKLAAVDTLGTEVGRYTLVALLTGADQNYYGTLSGAKSLYPPVVLK
ncbi:MAG: copper transporter [Coriobacteriia bacterium]|nr:copper transporter [Coriobacteriia bacterium]